jgi:hypothetical protein
MEIFAGDHSGDTLEPRTTWRKHQQAPFSLGAAISALMIKRKDFHESPEWL